MSFSVKSRFAAGASGEQPCAETASPDTQAAIRSGSGVNDATTSPTPNATTNQRYFIVMLLRDSGIARTSSRPTRISATARP